MTIEWTQNVEYGATALLGSPHLQLAVWWDVLKPQGYVGDQWAASVFGARFKTRFATAEQAKAAAEREARRLIALAVAVLGAS